MVTSDPRYLAAGLQRFGLERDRMRAALARQGGISATDLDALEHLEADGPLTQRQLGERLSLTSGAITMLVDRLEHAGWVRRGPHPTDRRYVLVDLSPAAAVRTPDGLNAYYSRIRDLVAAVPHEHRDAIISFLADAAAAAATAGDELRREAAAPKA